MLYLDTIQISCKILIDVSLMILHPPPFELYVDLRELKVRPFGESVDNLLELVGPRINAFLSDTRISKSANEQLIPFGNDSRPKRYAGRQS